MNKRAMDSFGVGGLALLSFLILSGCRHEVSATSAVGTFRSQIPAYATRGGKIDGTVYYKVYKAEARRHGSKTRPIERCVLQHGYGLTQDTLNLGQKLGPDSKLGKFGYDAMDFFASLYWGKAFIHQLLSNACDEVYVTVQESNNTTILEMTRRTEALLRDEICKTDGPSGKIACALVGHSKGGAVAFSIARRCMEQTSTLGKNGCGRIGKVYSATGVIQGAGIPALLYGAKKNDVEQVFDGMEALSSRFSIVLSAFGKKAVGWDLNSDYIPGNTNPTWFDLSPIASMDGNAPLYWVNDVALQKKGWLVADFGASASEFDFESLNFSEDLDFANSLAVDDALDAIKWDGCGDRGTTPSDPLEAARHYEQIALCKSFGRSLVLVHSRLHRKTFEFGVGAIADDMARHLDLRISGGNLDLLKDKLTWDVFQTGDGFADKDLAIGACLKGKSAQNSAVSRCTVFRDLNHQATAGGAREAADDMVAHLVE